MKAHEYEVIQGGALLGNFKGRGSGHIVYWRKEGWHGSNWVLFYL